MKNLKPIFINNSKLPVWLSKLAPIEIWALSFFIFVWCRGEINEQTKRHETIHFQQQIELLFVGQWILYGIFHLYGLIKEKGDSEKAYYHNFIIIDCGKDHIHITCKTAFNLNKTKIFCFFAEFESFRI